VRSGDIAGYTMIASDDSMAEDRSDPRCERWWLRALDELASGSTQRIAAMGLEAIEKAEKARERSRNLNGPVIHDLRVGAKIARQACLALCQYASRFGADRATAEALTSVQAQVVLRDKEIRRLKDDLHIAENSRRYLLKQKETSRGPSPTSDPVPLARGTRQSVHDRRGESLVRSPSNEWAMMDQDPSNVLVPEVVMIDPAGEGGDHNRSPSPMARFAAADPQVTGVLQDIVQSLRGLEHRLGALEGRLGTAPAPDEGVVIAAPASAPGTDIGKKKKAKKKKGAVAAGQQTPVTPRPPKTATSKVAVPPVRSRAGPLGGEHTEGGREKGSQNA